MPTQAEIIVAMQNSSIEPADPINTSADPAYAISYQFDDSLPADSIGGTYTGWTPWTATEKVAVNAALAHFETFLNIRFSEVTGENDPVLTLGRVQLDSLGTNITGQGGTTLGFTGFSTTNIFSYDSVAVYDVDYDITDDRGLNLIFHELGHALGLKHPFENPTLDPAFDNNHYTVLSYTADPFSAGDPDGNGFNGAMMLYDVLALQDIWGVSEYNTTSTTYTGPRTANVDVIWDTGGTDTFDASTATHVTILDLGEGRFSTFGTYEDVAIAYGVTIENAIGGTVRDRLVGNDADNNLEGGHGYDRLHGGNGDDHLEADAGFDWVWGGDGDDILKGGAGGDTLDGEAGNDLLFGGTGNDTLIGGADSDHLRGQDGNDTLLGGTGSDTLRGGGGADNATGGDGIDFFVFAPGDDTLTITDFEDGVDRLRLLGYNSSALSGASDVAGDVVIDLGGGDVITVENITLADLTDDIFFAV